MKFVIALEMMAIGVVLVGAGVALRAYTSHRAIGAVLIGTGIGVLANALILPLFSLLAG